MGREFEAKVLLTADEFINILTNNSGVCLSVLSSKADIYYSKYSSNEEAIKNGESLTRIRYENDKTFLTLKNKEKSGNFENNKEYETRIGDVYVIEKLLTEAGYTPYFKKYKTAYPVSYYKPDHVNGITVNIELEKIENSKHKEKPTYKCFYALEIEALVEPGFNIDEDQLSHTVIEAFESFGYAEKDFETRSWQELLK